MKKGEGVGKSASVGHRNDAFSCIYVLLDWTGLDWIHTYGVGSEDVLLFGEDLGRQYDLSLYRDEKVGLGISTRPGKRWSFCMHVIRKKQW